MIVVPATELVGMFVLALVVLRAAWLVTHPAVHHAACQPTRWSREVDRALHTAQHRA